MSKPSEAYLLAEHIHSSFFGPDATLPPADIGHSQIKSVVGSQSSKTSERIETKGVIDERLVFQTLAKDKLGAYHLATTPLESGPLTHVQIRYNTPLEAVEVLVGTIFMSKLVEIAHQQSIT